MASLQVSKLETDVHIKAPAKKFHDAFCRETHDIAKISPGNINGVDIHEGEWGPEGSIIFWNYVHVCIEGAGGVDRQREEQGNIQSVGRRSVGRLQRLQIHNEVFPQEKGSVVHWTLEYEKLKDHSPDPHTMFQLTVVKDIDSHLVA